MPRRGDEQSAVDPPTGPGPPVLDGADELRLRLATAALRFEVFLGKLAVRLQGLPPERLDEAISESLQALVETLDVDSTSLQALSEDGTSHRTTHGYSQPGTRAPELGVNLAATLPWTTEQVRRGRMLVLPRLPEGLPEEAHAERAHAASTGMTSQVILAMRVDREIVGSLQIATFHRSREIPPALLPRLELVAGVFANALYRKRAERRLSEAKVLNRTVLESTTNAIALLDRQGRVVAVNAAWAMPACGACRTARVATGEDYRQACRSALAEEPSASALMAGVEAVLSGRSTRHELTLRCRCVGRECVFLVALSSLDTEAGGAVATWTNVTELDQSRAALERDLRDERVLTERLEAENLLLQRQVRRSKGFDEIVGTSRALDRVLQQIEQVAATDAPVLILGETGTGKELVARAIHGRSRRKGRPLVTVNCAALPATLMESELFGYEKGAFTDATARTTGRFEAADGAAILLDEIGELPVEVQPKLLRVLEGGALERLGSSKTVRVDVRIIAATNRDLNKEMKEGRFRADLFYRLNVFPISVPPLRERAEDIPLLVWHFITRKEAQLARSVERVPEQFMRELVSYSWPGNVRELENVIERALIVTEGDTLAVPQTFGDLESDARLA